MDDLGNWLMVSATSFSAIAAWGSWVAARRATDLAEQALKREDRVEAARRRAVGLRTATAIRRAGWMALATADKIRRQRKLPDGYAGSLDASVSSLRTSLDDGVMDHLGPKGASLLETAVMHASTAADACGVAMKFGGIAPPAYAKVFEDAGRGLYQVGLEVLEASGCAGDPKPFEEWAAGISKACDLLEQVPPPA